MIRSTPHGLVDEGPSRARPRTDVLRAPRLERHETPSRAQRERQRGRRRRMAAKAASES